MPSLLESAWQQLYDDYNTRLARMRVPGGWLYLHCTFDDDTDSDGAILHKLISESMTFVPDPPFRHPTWP